MTEAAGFFFETDIEATRRTIAQELSAIVRDVDAAESRLGRSTASSNFLDRYIEDTTRAGANLIQAIRNLGIEAQTALRNGLTPPDVSKGIQSLVAQYKTSALEIQQALSSVPAQDANSDVFRRITGHTAAEFAAKGKEELQKVKADLAREGLEIKIPGASLGSLGGFADSKKFTQVLDTAIPDGARKASRAMQVLLDDVGRTSTGFRRLSDDQKALLTLASQGKGTLGAFGVQATGETGKRLQFTDPQTGNLLEVRGRQINDITAQQNAAAEKAKASTDKEAAAEAKRAQQAEKQARLEQQLYQRAVQLEQEANDATNRVVKANVLRALEAEKAASRAKDQNLIVAPNGQVSRFSRDGLSATRENNPDVVDRANNEVALATQREAQQRENLARQIETNAGLLKSDDRFTQVGRGGAAFDAKNAAFVDTKTGELITNMGRVRTLTGELSGQMHNLAEAEFKAAKTGPADEFFKGFLGAGGRKYRGGASAIDSSFPFNGFAETAGVVAKYEVLGRGILALSQAAAASFTDFAQLDHAVAEFDGVVGKAGAASQDYINDLENLSVVAGIDVVDALEAATRGVAAFASASASSDSKLDTGRDFVRSVAQNAIITNQTPQASANDLIAVGTSFGLTADRLGEVNNAIATARHVFGADAGAISQGLQLIADVGQEAGFSLSELSQVLGLVQSRTGESGTALAGNLQRIFGLFAGSGGKTALRDAGVDATGSIKDQIDALAKAYPNLTDAQKQSVQAGLGGTKALRDLIPLLNENKKLQQAYTAAVQDGNAGNRSANAEINSLAGQLRQFAGLIRTIAVDLARTGILTPIIVGLEALKPLLTVLDRALQLYDRLPAVLKGSIAVLAELALAWKIVQAAQIKAISGDFTGGVTGVVARFFDRTKPGSVAGTFEDGLGPRGRFANSIDNLATTQATGTAEIALARQRVEVLTLSNASEAELAAAKAALAEAEAAASAQQVAAMESVTIAHYEMVTAQEAEIVATDRVSLAMNAFAVSMEAAAGGGALDALSDLANGGAARRTASVAELAAIAEPGLIQDYLNDPAHRARIEALRPAVRNGTIDALSVLNDPRTGRGLIEDGHHRLAAAGLEGVTELPIEVKNSNLRGQGALTGLTAATTAATVATVAETTAKEAGVAAEIEESVANQRAALSVIAFTTAIREAAISTAQFSKAQLAKVASPAEGSLLARLGVGKNATGIGAAGLGLTAATVGAGLFIDNELRKANNSIQSAFDKGIRASERLNSTGDDPEALKDAASELSAAAGGLRESSGGIVGSTTDVLRQIFGADDASTTADRLQARASQAQATASRISRAQSAAAADGFIDFTAVDGVKTGLEAMANSGLTARQQLEGLIKSLDTLTITTSGKRVILPAQAKIFANKIATEVAGSVADFTDFAFDQGLFDRRNPTNAKVAVRGPTLAGNDLAAAGKALRGLDLNEFNKGIATDLNKFLKGNIATGAELDKGQVDSIMSEAEKAMKDRLAEQGVVFKDLPKRLQRQLLAGAHGGAAQVINGLKNAPAKFTDENIREAIKNAPGLANTVQGDTQVTAALDGTAGGGALAGAKARQSFLKQLLDAAVRLKRKPAELAQLRQELAAADLALQGATIAALKGGQDLANSLLSPFDKTGLIQSGIDNLKSILKLTTDKADRQAIRAQINQLKQQRAQQKVVDTNAEASADVDPRDALKAAKVQLDNDKRQLDLIVGQDGSGEDLANIRKSIKNDRESLRQAQGELEKAKNSVDDFAGGSKVQGAADALADAKIDLDNAKAGTVGFYNALKAERQARFNYAQAVAEARATERELNSDITDPVVQATNALKTSRGALRRDKRFGADDATLNTDELQVKKDEASLEREKFSQRLSDAQTNHELGRTSFQAYISYLNSEHDRLSAIKDRTRQQQDELNQVDRLMKDAKGQLDAQFGFGDIKLPTPYEVRRSLGLDAIAAAQTTAASLAGNIQPQSFTSSALGAGSTGAQTALIDAIKNGKVGGQVVQIDISGADTQAVLAILRQYLGPQAVGRTGAHTGKGKGRGR